VCVCVQSHNLPVSGESVSPPVCHTRVLSQNQ